jgi:hypothetical protein
MAEDISDLTPMLDREAEVSQLIFIFFYFNNLFYFQSLVQRTPSRVTRFRNAVTMIVLFLINLLNYMDRFAIAGIFIEY